MPQTLPIWRSDTCPKPQSRLLKLFLLLPILGVIFTVHSFSTTGHLTTPPSTVAVPVSVSVQDVLTCSNEIPGLNHEMSDEELFGAALMVQPVRGCKKLPKVAFMFLTKGPLPLAPLWERFFEGGEGRYSVYVHGSPSYKEEFGEESVFYQRQIPSQATEWGMMSLTDAERRLLANALLDPSNERFVLLSESCVPLYNFGIIYQYLMKSQHCFVNAFDDPSPYGRGRYDLRMEPEVAISQWRKGAQWYEVNREAATNIIMDTKYYKKFSQFCKPGCFVDEHYRPTMLTIESPHLLANRTVTWVDWSSGGPHPKTFGKDDVTEVLLKSIVDDQSCLYNDRYSSVCFLFARKFGPGALEPLLDLAPNVLGFGWR